MSRPSSWPTANSQPTFQFTILRWGMDALDLRYRNVNPAKSTSILEIFESAHILTGTRRVLWGDPKKMCMAIDRTRYGFSPFLSVNPAMMHPQGARFFEPEGVFRLAEYGIPVTAPPSVRRMDQSVDVEFEADVSQVVLDALAGLRVPRHKILIRRAPGRDTIESVVWETRDGIKLRVYDRHAAGREIRANGFRVLRFERQHCPRPRAQRDLSTYLEQDHSRTVLQPFNPYGDRVVVGDRECLYAEICRMHAAGEMYGAVAERMRRVLRALRRSGAGHEPTPSLPDESIDDFRKRGLAFSITRDVPVNLSELFAAVRQPWANLALLA